jgi:transposase-like protein
MVYLRYELSYRNVEGLLAERASRSVPVRLAHPS